MFHEWAVDLWGVGSQSPGLMLTGFAFICPEWRKHVSYEWLKSIKQDNPSHMRQSLTQCIVEEFYTEALNPAGITVALNVVILIM